MQYLQTSLKTFKELFTLLELIGSRCFEQLVECTMCLSCFSIVVIVYCQLKTHVNKFTFYPSSEKEALLLCTMYFSYVRTVQLRVFAPRFCCRYYLLLRGPDVRLLLRFGQKIIEVDPSFEARPGIFILSPLGDVMRVGDPRYNVYLLPVQSMSFQYLAWTKAKSGQKTKSSFT